MRPARSRRAPVAAALIAAIVAGACAPGAPADRATSDAASPAAQAGSETPAAAATDATAATAGRANGGTVVDGGRRAETPSAASTTAPPAAATASPDAPLVDVAILGLSFGPSLTVPAGTHVRWVNEDQVVHDVRAEDGSWGSPELIEGDSYERVFARPGTYRYMCTLHFWMHGEITVR